MGLQGAEKAHTFGAGPPPRSPSTLTWLPMSSWPAKWRSTTALPCGTAPFCAETSIRFLLASAPMCRNGALYTPLGLLLQGCQLKHQLRGSSRLAHTVSCVRAQLSLNALLGNTLSLWRVPWSKHILSLKLGPWFLQGGEYQVVSSGLEAPRSL